MDELKIMERVAWGSLLSAVPAFAVVAYTSGMTVDEAIEFAGILGFIVACGVALILLSRKNLRATDSKPATSPRQHPLPEQPDRRQPAK